MAIQKEKTLDSGVVGNYWRIVNITIDRQNLKIISQIALFKDQAASNSGKSPIGEFKTFRFPLIISEITPPTDLIAYIYIKIQNNADIVITKDILGNDLETPTTVDPDLSNGIAVL